MFITNQIQTNLKTKNYDMYSNFKAKTAIQSPDYSRLYAEADKIFCSLKELTSEDVDKQLLRIKRHAPKDAKKLYDNLQNDVKKYPRFALEKANIYLDKFILKKDNDIYYNEFLTDGLMYYKDEYNKHQPWFTPVTLPRYVEQVLLHRGITEKISDKDLSDKLCKLGASPNVDVNELIIQEGELSGQTFTSETVNNLISNNKYDIALRFIKTIAKRDDYSSASRDLYTILENTKTFSYEMIDIIDTLMNHKSFNPNFVMNYYEKGAFGRPGRMNYLNNEPDLTLAYQFFDFDKRMKKHNLDYNLEFFKKLISHHAFEPAFATKNMDYHLKSVNEMREFFINNY